MDRHATTTAMKHPHRIIPVSLRAALLLIVAATAAQSQGAWVLLNAQATTLVRSGTDAMYNMRYAEADSIFRELISRDPTHPAGYFLLALVDWWRMVPNLDQRNSQFISFEKSFDDRIDKVVETCDDRLATNANDIVGLFFKGSALGYRARLATTLMFSSNNPLTLADALDEASEAYNLILRCQRLAPSNSDILLGSGLYNYLGAYIPEKYPILKPLVGYLPPGDKAIGLSMLRISGQKAVYAGTEARYSLLDILANMEEDYGQALPVARELHTQYPGNSVFFKFYARALYQTSDFAAADTAWMDILWRVQRNEPGYNGTLARQGLYFVGDCRLRSGDFASALKCFNEAIRISGDIFDDDESGWLVMTWLKKGMVLDKMGKRKEAISAYEEVLDKPNRRDSHVQAERYIAKAYQ